MQIEKSESITFLQSQQTVKTEKYIDIVTLKNFVCILNNYRDRTPVIQIMFITTPPNAFLQS